MSGLGCAASDFNAESEVTCYNSARSKAEGVADLVVRGCREIYILTTPGPAKNREYLEHCGLSDAFPGVTFHIRNFEIDFDLAREYGIRHADLMDGLTDFIYDAPVDHSVGLFVEWDHTHTMSKLVRDGTWNRMLRLLAAARCKMQVTFALTHSSRESRGRQSRNGTFGVAQFNPVVKYPTEYDRVCLAEAQLRGTHSVAWEGFLLQELQNKTYCNPVCLFSSRNYWRRQLRCFGQRVKKIGSPTHRWVFAL